MPFVSALSGTMLFCELLSALTGPTFPQELSKNNALKKVWTNDDLHQTTRQPAQNYTSSTPEELPPASPAQKHYLRAKDPKWYGSQIEPLQRQIVAIEIQLREMREAQKGGRGISGAINLDQETEGITTDAQIGILEQRRKQLLQQIDGLEDQSRHNDLDPGDIRSASSADSPAASVEILRPADDDPQIAETQNSIRHEIGRLQRAKNEKDILQRGLTLKSREITSNPEYLTRHTGSSKLAAGENEIRSREEEISNSEERLAEPREHLQDQKVNLRATPPSEANAAAPGPAPANVITEKTEAYWRKAFSELHYKIRMAQTEIDLLQRELNVALVQYDPNPAKAMRESFTRKQINEHRQKIENRKIEILQLKREESDLEDDLRHSGGHPGWSRE